MEKCCPTRLPRFPDLLTQPSKQHFQAHLTTTYPLPGMSSLPVLQIIGIPSCSPPFRLLFYTSFFGGAHTISFHPFLFLSIFKNSLFVILSYGLFHVFLITCPSSKYSAFYYKTLYIFLSLISSFCMHLFKNPAP